MKRFLKRVTLAFLLAAMLLSVACGDRIVSPSEETTAGQGSSVASADATEPVSTDEPNPNKRDPQQIENYGRIDYNAGDGLLYNGIRLPEIKAADPTSDAVVTPSYLISEEEGGTHPDTVDITVGRQLFVDSFLIESTELETVYHQAEKYSGNPILKPTTVAEFSGGWGVGTSAGGIWYDMQDQKYKMWYDVGFNPMLGYAESDDGINWTRVNVDDTGKNIVMDASEKNGTCSVFIDYDADPSEKYKMFVQSLDNEVSDLDGYETLDGNVDEHSYVHTLFTSSDGLHWVRKGDTSLGGSGDMTTAFYNAFTHKWVNSLRGYARTNYKGSWQNRRARWYAECDTFEDLLNWTSETAVFWMHCDKNDTMDANAKVAPQLYNFGAIAYESIMLGSFTVWRGPENHIIETTGSPKVNEILMSYSRDGYNYDRPDRTPFIGVSGDGYWDKGYLFSSIGGIIVHDDVLYIYYSGFSGYNGTHKNAHGNEAIGLATIRRDGFASLDGRGTTLTQKLTVNQDKKYLFVNIDVPADSFKAEILDADGNVVEGFSMEDCIAVGGDDTCRQITWKNGKDLSFLNGTEFRIRFSMEQDGSFYAFWLSDSLNGESGGAVAAGYAGN